MRSTNRAACMYRELCNLHMRRTACYACIQCTLRITCTYCIHLSRSPARMACTARKIADGHMARAYCMHCTHYICPGRDISTSTRSDLHPRSDTSVLPHRTSGRALQRNENTSICRTQPIHTGTARSTRNARTRCEQWDSRRSQGDITGLFDLHSKRSTSANCGMKL